MIKLPMKKTLVGLATRWGTTFGGINSFNKDMLTAFAGISFADARTICIVLHAERTEIEDAASEEVTLLSLDRVGEKAFSADFRDAVWELLGKSGIDININETIWLGHDRVTGQVALSLAEKHGGRAALIHHMSYGSYEAFAENSNLANQKEDEQKALFARADICIAIGPLLRDRLSDMLGTETVPMIIPGLPDITVRKNPRVFKAFVSGRLSDDAKKIKQAYLGVAAFSQAVSLADKNNGLPDILKGESDPKLTLRGVDFEENVTAEGIRGELELKKFAEKYAGRAFALHALPFTTSREQLFADLAGASVALMPSWHEGFGLVAWEAIAAGVPLIITRKSGVYRLLKELDDNLYLSLVTAVNVAGCSDEPFFQDKDVAEISESIINIAKDPAAFRQRAARLREELAKRYTWAHCARQFAQICGWDFEDNLSIVSPPVNEVDLAIAPRKQEQLLEIPRSTWRIEDGRSDSQLLRAEEAIIAFNRKREPFLNNLIDWVCDTTYPVSVRLLIGSGGTGKTRLAIEMCNRLLAIGWEAGFLPSNCDLRGVAELANKIRHSDRQVLVVLDYAETRQQVILTLLRGILSLQREKEVRILLLARSGGEWWSLLPSKDSFCEPLLEGMATTGPFQLPELHDTESDRNEAYREALSTFATRLRLPIPDHFPHLGEPHFAYPLYVQMAALIALRGERPRSAEGLTRTLVGHERRYWRNALAGLEAPPDILEDQAALLMSLITLAGSVPTFKQIERVWDAAGGDKALLRYLFSTLGQLYPTQNGLESLRPDLLGEALIAQVLLTSAGADLLNSVMRFGDQKLKKSSLTVISRMLRNRADISELLEDVLFEHFVPCAHDLAAVCIETPSPLPVVVERAFSRLDYRSQLQAAGLLEADLTFEALPLSGLDVLVSQVLVTQARKSLRKQTSDAKAVYARSLSNLAVALSRDGQLHTALVIATEALEVRRKLAQVKPERFEPELATSLNIYAGLMSQTGSNDVALIAGGEALVLNRKLAKARPDKFDADLAKSLGIYSEFLGNEGKAEDAINYSRQSLEIRERLAAKEPEEYEPALALALSSYAVHLSNHGYVEDAVYSVNRAVEMFERLAKEKPERFEAQWADALINLSNIHTEQGQSKEAELVTKRALVIYRRLALSKPERFEGDLARALTNYAADLGDNGSPLAVELAEEALAIHRRLVSSDSKRFASDLAKTLSNYASHLSQFGQVERALIASREALEIRRALADESPERYDVDLAISFSLYGWHLAAAGKWDEAAISQRQANAILSRCAERIPQLLEWRVQQGKLTESFWDWLAGSKMKLESSIQQPIQLTQARAWRSVLFQSAWQRAIAERTEHSICIALEKWDELDPAQREAWKDCHILIAALAENELGSARAPKNWREQLKAYQIQVKNQVPCWMLETAWRLGIVLDT